MVGMQGIEPCTSCSQSRHATDAPHPDMIESSNLIVDICQANTIQMMYLLCLIGIILDKHHQICFYQKATIILYK